MCVAAPEDPPQNVVFRNITSKSLSLTWDPPKITTGRFSYVIQLHSSEGNTNTPWPPNQFIHCLAFILSDRHHRIFTWHKLLSIRCFVALHLAHMLLTCSRLLHSKPIRSYVFSKPCGVCMCVFQG